MSSSNQARRKRLNELAVALDNRYAFGAHLPLDGQHGFDLRALLATERKLRRELSIRRGIERELFELMEGLMVAQCPPWARGDEPEECPEHDCSKCWRKYFDGKLRKGKL